MLLGSWQSVLHGFSAGIGAGGGGGLWIRLEQGLVQNQVAALLPCPPLANSRVSATVSRVGGGDGCQVTVSRGGGGDCKGISRQIVVPSTDASKENTCEATFALMLCQCVSSNTNVIEDPKER